MKIGIKIGNETVNTNKMRKYGQYAKVWQKLRIQICTGTFHAPCMGGPGGPVFQNRGYIKLIFVNFVH